MSALSSAGLIICVCCIGASIVSLLTPSGRMKKIVSLILGVFLICSLAIPIKGLFSSFDIDTKVEKAKLITDADEAEYNKAVLSQTAKNLVSAADSLLKSEGIQADNIEVGLKISEDNSIYISKLNIYISNEYIDRQDEITQIMKENMSKKPVVIVSEEEKAD